MTKGERIQVDWDFGTVRGVGRRFVYVELDEPRGKPPVKFVLARSVTVRGGIASVTYWTTKKERKRAKKEGA